MMYKQQNQQNQQTILTTTATLMLIDRRTRDAEAKEMFLNGDVGNREKLIKVIERAVDDHAASYEQFELELLRIKLTNLRRKRGKSKPPALRHDHIVTVGLTPSQYGDLKTAATSAGVSMAQYIRAILGGG
jgi:hypothetical protein